MFEPLGTPKNNPYPLKMCLAKSDVFCSGCEFFDLYNQYSYWLIAAKMSSSICKDKPILPNPRKMLPLRSNMIQQISANLAFLFVQPCTFYMLFHLGPSWCYPFLLPCEPCPYDRNVLFLKLSKKMMTPNGRFEDARFFLRAILGGNNCGTPMDKWSPTK